MTDLEIAKNHLNGHSICLCHDGSIVTDDGRGISPMMRFLAEGKELTDYSAADLIVGKATAMLFVKAGIRAVYGKVMSKSAKKFLKAHGIICEYETLTEQIINRAGTDICPMEKTVSDMENPEEAYQALCARIVQIKQNPEKSI